MVIGETKHIINCFRTERPSSKIATSQLTSKPTSAPSTFPATTTATGTETSTLLIVHDH